MQAKDLGIKYPVWDKTAQSQRQDRGWGYRQSRHASCGTIQNDVQELHAGVQRGRGGRGKGVTSLSKPQDAQKQPSTPLSLRYDTCRLSQRILGGRPNGKMWFDGLSQWERTAQEAGPLVPLLIEQGRLTLATAFKLFHGLVLEVCKSGGKDSTGGSPGVRKDIRQINPSARGVSNVVENVISKEIEATPRLRQAREVKGVERWASFACADDISTNPQASNQE